MDTKSINPLLADQPQRSRREFLRSAMAAGLTAPLGVPVPSWSSPGQQAVQATTPGALFEGYAVPIEQKMVWESTLVGADNGQYWLMYGDKQKRLFREVSTDGGRTWEKGEAVVDHDGSFISMGRNTPHISIFQLKSGALGMVYGGPYSRPGRDGTLFYRTSNNGGKSWSAATVVDPVFGICRAGAARVLRTGRIVVPAFKWISPAGGPSSEEEANSITYSWIFYSDDEGQTWHRSLSELFVSLDQGRLGSYCFEEPSLEELNDGRVLMYGRTELGHFYQTISTDGGVNWSVPQAAPQAASYTPPFLIRISETTDLLLVWNQVSTDEILAGLARHRLSTAISSDDGVTWQHFRNLESLDDRTKIDAPTGPPQVYRMVNYGYPAAPDPKKYPHAPGCVRICYPTVAFRGNEVAFAYDYGYSGPRDLKNGSTTKIKVVSRDWLYEKTPGA